MLLLQTLFRTVCLVGAAGTYDHTCACIACADQLLCSHRALATPIALRHQDVSVETDKQGRSRVRYEKGGTYVLWCMHAPTRVKYKQPAESPPSDTRMMSC
jgi:hypothetical protein